MRITVLGAARTVTGSCFLTETRSSGPFLVDCGMHQGGRQIETRNQAGREYRIPELQAIFITHAHIDHSGLVPRLARFGYRGPVYATEATCDLLRVLWQDAAHIQEMESEWQTRKNKRKGRRTVPPLYEAVDAETAASLLRPMEMGREHRLLDGVAVRFITAGHILGAASLHLTLTEDGVRHHLGFSGDLGRPGQLIVPDAEPLPALDSVFMETTYGNRHHKSLTDSIEELIDVIQQAQREGGKVIIPAFAVERTQEIIYTLARAYEDGRLPKDMPVFLDSPLAIEATRIFRRHPEFFDDETKEILKEGRTPINLPTLQFTSTTRESQAINEQAGPAIIIAGSGMANAGRIKHHLKHNLWRENSHIVIVGFQAQGTTGRRLVEGATRVKIFQEDVAVKAKVHTIGGFSAHADQEELLGWLAGLMRPGLNVYLVHGEEQSSMAFMDIAQSRFPEAVFHLPRYKEIIQLEGTAETPVLPTEDAAARMARVRDILDRLQGRLGETAESQDLQRLRLAENALLRAERLLSDVSAEGKGG